MIPSLRRVWLVGSLLGLVGAASVAHAVPSGAPSAGPSSAAPLEAPSGPLPPSAVQTLGAMRAHESIVRLDVNEAREKLAPLDAADQDVAVERALLAVYEDDCDTAMATLMRAGIDRKQGGPAELAGLVRGCMHVVASTTVLDERARGYIVRLMDEDDAPLVPFLLDVADQSLAALERDLKVRLPRPVHLDIVRDQFSLAAMTGLPEEAAQTTGTVAIAKWGRVTMLSPRATPHGYTWSDTLTHELTHLSVTRASTDRAPLWLQEGVAKREETRWRAPLPYDDQPPPDAVARLGFDRGLGLSLDKLGPSIAMLPTAEQAMVAFAEVNSFVRYWIRENGDPALGTFLHALSDAPVKDGVDMVLRQQTGSDLAAWSDRWRRTLDSVTPSADVVQMLPPPKDAPRAAPAEKKPSLYRSARLAELLGERGHTQQALPYARRTLEAAPRDPSAHARLALLLHALGRHEEADALVASLDQVRSAHGVFLALHAAAQRRRGDDGAARQMASLAVGLDPLDATVACAGLGPDEEPADPPAAALCRIVRRR